MPAWRPTTPNETLTTAAPTPKAAKRRYGVWDFVPGILILFGLPMIGKLDGILPASKPAASQVQLEPPVDVTAQQLAEAFAANPAAAGRVYGGD